MLSVLLVFFFKQKTAYEMRISDWSSDVCSSDLNHSCLLQTRMVLVIPYQIDIPQEYNRLILWISENTGLADNLLHIHSGLIILLVARLITCRPYRSFLPFLCVFLAEEIGIALLRERVCLYR